MPLLQALQFFAFRPYFIVLVYSYTSSMSKEAKASSTNVIVITSEQQFDDIVKAATAKDLLVLFFFARNQIIIPSLSLHYPNPFILCHGCDVEWNPPCTQMSGVRIASIAASSFID